MHILHYEPINCLFVLPVDSSSLDQLGLDASYGVGMIVRVLNDVTERWQVLGGEIDYQVNCKRVDHCESFFL